VTEALAPYGGDPVPADLDAMRSLGGLLAGTADAARLINELVAGIAQSAELAVWSGESADAFRSKLSNMPELVGKVERSYGDAAEAVRVFLLSTQATRSDADGLVGSAWAVSEQSEATAGLDPGGLDTAQRRADAVQAVTDMTAKVSGLRSDYLRAETTLVDALGVAKAEGIPPDSFWHKLVVSVEEWSGTLGKYLAFLVIVAFVVVVVVVTAGSGLGVLFAIGAALELLGPVLTMSLVLGIAHLGTGADHKIQYGDDGTAPSWTALGVETALIVLPFGAGKAAKSLGAAGREGQGLFAAGGTLSKLANGLAKIDEGAQWASKNGWSGLLSRGASAQPDAAGEVPMLAEPGASRSEVDPAAGGEPTPAPGGTKVPDAANGQLVQRELGIDPAVGKFRQSEYDTACRIQSERNVQLTRSDRPNVDWIDQNGKTWDAVGNYKSEHFNKQWPNLQYRIVQHMEKADFVPVDVSQFTPEQIDQVRKFIAPLGPRVFLVGE
jgi:hypothetical protein